MTVETYILDSKTDGELLALEAECVSEGQDFSETLAQMSYVLFGDLYAERMFFSNELNRRMEEIYDSMELY